MVEEDSLDYQEQKCSCLIVHVPASLKLKVPFRGWRLSSRRAPLIIVRN